MDNQVLGYKDLAAIPKDKAILDIERPDLMIYEPHFTYSLLDHVELPRSREVSGVRDWLPSPLDGVWNPSVPSFTETSQHPRRKGLCLGIREWTCTTHQHLVESRQQS